MNKLFMTKLNQLKHIKMKIINLYMILQLMEHLCYTMVFV